MGFTIRSTAELIRMRNLQDRGRVQQFIDNEVLRYSDPYIPFDTGALKSSGIRSTVIGSGRVRYDTPYAKHVYYANRGTGTQGTAYGGKRGRLWFERMKTDHKKDILRGARAIAGANNN